MYGKLDMEKLSLTQNQISPRDIDQLSGILGENPDRTHAALNLSFAALLGSLIGKANASTEGAADIFNMLTHEQIQGGWPEKLDEVMEGLVQGTPKLHHQLLLTALLGPRIGLVADVIGTRCRIRIGSAMSLLGIAAPLLMGAINRQVASLDIGPAGLGELLRGQTPSLGKILPSELSDTLEIAYLFSRSGNLSLTNDTKAPLKPSVTKKLRKWALVPIVMLVCWFAAGRLRPVTEMGGTSEAADTSAISGSGSKTASAADLSFRGGGFAEKVAKTTENPSLATPEPPTDLTESSKANMRVLASILLSSPDMKIYITGRDTTALAGKHLADAVKNTLLSDGVAEDRISARGESGPPALKIFLLPSSVSPSPDGSDQR